MRAFSSSLLLVALASSSLACNAILGIEDVDLDESAAQGGQGGTTAGVSGSSGQAGAGQAGNAGESGAAGDAGQGGAGAGGASGSSGQAGTCPSSAGASGTAGAGGGGPVQQVLVPGARQPAAAFLGATASSALPAIEPCPAGYVLAGLAGRIDPSTTSAHKSSVTNLRGECRPLRLSKDPSPVVTTGAVDYRTRPVGSWPQGTTAWSNRCPDGEVVVGAHVDATADGSPGDLVVSCAPLSLSCAGPYVASLGTAHDVGNDILETTSSKPGGACPAGTVAVGLRSVGDVVIEGAALECAPLSVVPSPGECATAADCAAPTSVCQVGSCVDGLCLPTNLPAGALPREIHHQDCQQIACQGDGLGVVVGDDNFPGNTCLGCTDGLEFGKTASCSLLSGGAETGACQGGICTVAGNNLTNRNATEKTGTTPTQLGLSFDNLEVPYHVLEGFFIDRKLPQPTLSVYESCGPGEVATGMVGRRSAIGSPTNLSIVEFGLRCSRLDLIAGQTTVTTTNSYQSASHYSQGVGAGWQFDCPAGSVMTLISIQVHDFPEKELIDGIGANCTPVSLDASNHLVIDQSKKTQPGSGTTAGASYFTYAGCPEGQVIVGMQGYGGITLADLGPMCAVPTVVPDPGECQDDSDCAVTSDCRRVACVRGLCDDRQIPAGWPARVQADDASTTTDNCQVRRCGLDGKSTIVTGEPTQPQTGGCFTCDAGQVSPRDEGTACTVDGGVVCTVSGACVGKI